MQGIHEYYHCDHMHWWYGHILFWNQGHTHMYLSCDHASWWNSHYIFETHKDAWHNRSFVAYYLDQIHVEIAILPRRLHGFHVFLTPHRVEVIGNLLMLFFIMHTSILSCIDKVDINIMRCEKYCERYNQAWYSFIYFIGIFGLCYLVAK